MRGRCCRVHYNQIGILEAKKDLPFPPKKNQSKEDLQFQHRLSVGCAR